MSDLPLLKASAREAGALVRELMGKPLDVKWKGEAGPVTNVDFAVDALLTERLRAARPDYGWLSEEAPDDPSARLGKRRVFMLDPIDGTSAMIARVPQFTISIGVVENGTPVAGAILNPMTDELFLGAVGRGATLNGRAIRVAARDTLTGARVIGERKRFAPGKWPRPWPQMDFVPRHSIAYRLALVAAAQADATLLIGMKHDWDLAAGAAIVAAAGGCVSDPWGKPIALNQQDARTPGLVASGAALHPLIIERTAHLTDPRAAKAPAHER